MKPTPFLKRAFASLITVAIATTLATAGLYQSAFAADIEETVSTAGSSSSPTAIISLAYEAADDYTADANITVKWDVGTSQGYAAGVNNTGSLGTFSGSISMNETDVGGVTRLFALYNTEDGTISKISDATISASADTSGSTGSYAYGIYNYGTITAIEGVTSITAVAYSTAYGIYNQSSGYIGSISDISIIATGSSGARGIYNGGDIDSISGVTITATTTNGDAIGISTSSNIDSINGSITAESTNNNAYALVGYGNVTEWNFDGATALSATGGDGNYAIYSYSSSSLTLKSEDTEGNAANATVSMTGDIYASKAALIFDSGNYVLESATTITAASVTINSGATLNLTDDTTFAITDNTLVLNVTGEVTQAMLDISATGSIISDNTLTITVNLDEAATTAYGNGSLVLFDEETAAALELANVTINVDGYGDATYTNVSASTLSGTFESDSGSIPEPSTATLSLLALTALLARRRRKA